MGTTVRVGSRTDSISGRYTVLCASREGGATEEQGTSFGEPLSMRVTWGFSCACCRQPRCISHVAGSIQDGYSSRKICCEEREGSHQVVSTCTLPASTGGRLEWHRLATDSMSSSTRWQILRMSRILHHQLSLPHEAHQVNLPR